MHRDVPFRQVGNRLLLALLCCASACELKAADPQLTMPAEFYAVAGSVNSVYFANTVLAEDAEGLQFEVTCDIGSADETRWYTTPDERDVGRHDFTLNVADIDGKQLASATGTLVVVPVDAGKGRSIRFLIIGDSLTHASRYPNEIARLLERSDNPAFVMLGTHKHAAFPDENPVVPKDLIATIYHALGVPAGQILNDIGGRPHFVRPGNAIGELLL